MTSKASDFLILGTIILGGTLATSQPAWSASLTWDNWANAGFASGANALAAPQSLAVGSGNVQVGFNVGAGTTMAAFNGGLTPQIDNVLNGSQADTDAQGNPINRSLHLQMDTNAGQYGNNNNVSMNVGFNGYGGSVSNVAFELYDIDMDTVTNSWQDLVQVIGYNNGKVVNPIYSNLGSTVANLGNGWLKGIGSSDNSSDTGNALVTFAGNIDTFKLIFTDGPSNQVDPASHGIGIGNIDFSYNEPKAAVPEPISLCALGLLPLVQMRVRRNKAKKCSSAQN